MALCASPIQGDLGERRRATSTSGALGWLVGWRAGVRRCRTAVLRLTVILIG